MRFRILFSFSLTFCLAISAMWPAVVVTQQQPQSPPGLDPARMAQQIERAKRMSSSVRRARKLMLDAGVPFEPTILFSRNWRQRVLPYLNVTPQMHEKRVLTGNLTGVQLADTLLLPEKIVLTGDAVILVRQLVFAGKHVEIRGTHDLHVFPIEPVLSVDTVVNQASRGRVRFTNAGFRPANMELASRLVRPETITIDLDGQGRREWLEKQKAAQQSVSKSHHSRVLSTPQNADGQPGQTGSAGIPGSPGQSQPQSLKGDNGFCGASPDGGEGSPGYTGIQGVAGGVGGAGQDGNPGGTLTYPLEGNTNYVFSAKGGEGGWGGRGADGGPGGPGGQGGNGGDGASCPCDQRSGNGGRGAIGGQGGPGNIGGDGGTGATGGRGGIINLTRACDYNGGYTTYVNGGAGGRGGDPGSASLGGQGGSAGDGGHAGSNIECLSLGGSNGQSGGPGATGDSGFGPGAPGENGSAGGDGSVNVTPAAGCDGGGGGGGGDLEPGSSDGYCTEWWWVQYSCTEELGENRSREDAQFLKATYRSRIALPVPEWHCVETGRWYAGCW